MADPIFIVGPPRSGTTLLAAMVAAHSRLSCGPETHFFITLAQEDHDERRLLEDWPRRGVEFLVSIRHVDKSVPENYGLSPEDIETYLRRRQPSVAALLEALTDQYMKRMGKARWCEKTPDHLAYVHLIRRHYASAPILRIIRDPRDMALSLMSMPWGRKTLPEAIAFWNDYHDRSSGFFAYDRRSLTVRYEDLVAAPEQELRRVCELIGEGFEPGMLQTEQSAAHVNRTNEPWKEKAGGPLDATRVAVWKRQMNDEDNRQAVELLGYRLEVFGYPKERSIYAAWLRTQHELQAVRDQWQATIAQLQAAHAELQTAHAELQAIHGKQGATQLALDQTAADLKILKESMSFKLGRALTRPLAWLLPRK